MAEEHKRTLHSEEDMLALAEELASRFPVTVHTPCRRPLKGWQERALWFLGGGAAASLAWWLGV